MAEEKKELSVASQIATYTPATITADFDGMREKLDGLLEPYRGVTDEALMKMSAKEVKACRADVNAIINNVEDARKAIKRAYNEPLAEFEAKVKELLEPARAAADQLKGVIDRKGAQERELRLEGLRNTYIDCAPALAEVVPFERILAEKPEWANKSYGAAKAAEEIIERTVKLAKDWASLQVMENSMAFYKEAEVVFFDTLDIGKAIDHNAQLEQRRAEIDAMREEVEGYREEQAAAVEPEPEPAAIETGELFEFSFTVECTKEQRDQIIAFLRSIGVHGKAGKAA